MVLLGAPVSYPRPLVGLFIIPRGFLPPCLFAAVVPASLNTPVSISICIYPIHLQNLSQRHYLQEATLSPSSCNLSTVPTRHAVHLINTLITRSVAAWFLVSKCSSPPAGEIFRGRGVIFLCPQGWALNGTATVAA